MNGRIYDPLLGRMLSADVLVQNPGSLQSYNRYSYVGNNPLSYTDPGGYFRVSPAYVRVAEQGGKQVLKRVSPWIAIPVAVAEFGAIVVEGADALDAVKMREASDAHTQQVLEEIKSRPVHPAPMIDPNTGQRIDPRTGRPMTPTPHEVKIDEGAIQNNGQGDTVNTTQSPNQEANPDAPKPEPKSDDSKNSSDAKDSKTAAADAASGDTPKLVDNPKHNPNSASPQPSNTKELFANSVVDKNGVRWAIDKDGTIHRFSKPSNGETHWNGSTAGDKPIREQNIPNDIRKRLEEELKKLKERK